MTWLKSPASTIVVFFIFILLSNCSENQVDIANIVSEDKAAEEIFNSGEREILRKRYSDAAEKLLKLKDFIPIQIGPNGH